MPTVTIERVEQAVENHELIILDGGMGTMLQTAGLPVGQIPELWNCTQPETVAGIHRQYVDAGSRVLYANTFGVNRLKAAGCILPVSHDLDIPKELGLRHRSAMGISQESDALAIVVSEETGAISIAVHGEFRLRLSAEELESFLTKDLG